MNWVRNIGMMAVVLCANTAFAGTVRLSTADGKSLSAVSYGTGEKGVLLIHDAKRDATDWENFADRLSANGFRVLVVDLRGHGGSKAAADPLGDADWLLMVDDIDAGAAWLSAKGAKSVSVVGAALGANLALNAASDNESINNVVMLSPGLNINGVKVGAAISAYGDRPLMLVADKGDAISAKAASLLEAKATGPKRLELVDGGASGHRLLNTVASLEPTLVGWLNGAFGEGMDLARPDRNLETGDAQDIETTGTKYEDR